MSVRGRVRRELVRVPGALPVARLTLETIRVCLRYRVTGLASEAGFFMLLSLPPLVLGLFGGVGYLGKLLGQDIVQQLVDGIRTFSERYVLEGVVTETIVPTVTAVLKDGRFDLISVGFLLSIWSGSRALNVFVDTISIMYGQSGVRGIVRTRALSLTLYFLSLLVGIVVIPLVVIGPEWLGQLLPRELHVLTYLYWPVVTVLAVASVATLFHISTPRRTPWLRDVPGGVLTLVIWVLASFVLRSTITASVRDGTSIYGPLSTPIVLLIWLYALAIAVLIGAALNAAIRTLWPVEERPSLRAQSVTWLKGRWAARRARGRGERGSEPTPDRGLEALEGDLAASVSELRDEARKPLTPMPDGADRTGLGSQFEDDAQDRILSVRTRSG
ncbi:YihY/virulence factor BrkB family protein [Nostocoides sp. HKS02]|uniref:YihY/virulence factor BrkB family protein n=1 Tax=Nostocoides sp. HKS02 TaxID=1813880 RepID=UPI001E655087|nr:YihY/virulence factor BrkB family protein [Tetrasphaera sp. HKS02]